MSGIRARAWRPLSRLHPRERAALVAQERHGESAMGHVSLLHVILRAFGSSGGKRTEENGWGNRQERAGGPLARRRKGMIEECARVWDARWCESGQRPLWLTRRKTLRRWRQQELGNAHGAIAGRKRVLGYDRHH